MKVRYLVLGILCVLPFFRSYSYCSAQAGASPLSPEAVLSAKKFTWLQQVSLSKDGRFAAYVSTDPKRAVKQSEMPSVDGVRGAWLKSGAPALAGASITVRDLKTGEDVTFSGMYAAWNPAWSPNDDRLAFLSDKDGQDALWIWEPDKGNDAHRVTAEPVTTWYYGNIFWTPDGRSIVLATPERSVWQQILGDSSPSSTQAPSAVEVRRWGFEEDNSAVGQIHHAPSTDTLDPFDVVRIDLADGKIHVLASGKSMIKLLDPSPDGKWIAYGEQVNYDPPNGARYQLYADLWIVPTVGGTPKRLVEHTSLRQRGFAWSPDSRSLALRRMGLPEEQALIVVPIDGTSPRRLADLSESGSYRTPVWEADGRHLLFWKKDEVRNVDLATGHDENVVQLPGKTIQLVLTRGISDVAYTSSGDLVVLAWDDKTLSSEFYRVSSSAHRAVLLKEGDSYFGGSYFQEFRIAVPQQGDRIVFTMESADKPAELWSTDVSFGTFVRSSDLGGAMWNVAMGTRRIVSWKNSDGSSARGLLLLPPNYDPHHRYPMVVWMYSYAWSKANVFGLTGQAVFNCQLLATRGIACLFPDLQWQRERVMQGLHEQVTAAIKAVVDIGIADPDRIGVEGQSSGGYDTLAVIATTPSVKAAVACSGIADMMTEYGTDAAGPEWVEDQMGVNGSPWDYPERYIANSPSFHMNQVKTPLLIVQGTDDTGTTIQMDLAFNLLKHLGRTVEYRRYAGEGHVPDEWNLSNQKDAVEHMLQWWDRYLIH